MKKIYSLLLVSLVVKIIIAALLPLSLDEAYYWTWSKNLSLSFFDHPPFIAWLFWIGNLFENLGHLARLPVVLLGHTTLFIWVLILKQFMDTNKVSSWIWLILLNPLMGIGSIIGTPDVPVVFFWSLSIYFLLQIFSYNLWPYYFGLGVALGLGFCSKYHIVLFVPALFLFLIFEKKYKEVVWKYVPLTVLGGLIFSFPVLWWNYKHDFVSFRFQLSHGLGQQQASALWPLEYFLGQFFILTPILCGFSIKETINKRLIYFIHFGWFPLFFFLVSSFRAATEANWPLMAIPSIAALAIENMDKNTNRKKWFWSHQIFWLCFYGVLVGSFAFSPVHDKINEPFKYKKYTYVVSKYAPLYTSDYQSASSLWYFTKSPVYKLRGASRFDYFDVLSGSNPKTEKFYYLKEFDDEFPKWLDDATFKKTSVEKNDLFEIFLVELI